MPRPDDVRIRHMVEAAQRAVAFAQGRTRSDLDSDEMLRFALVKLVEIVGEAAKQVTDETRKRIQRWRGPSLRGCATDLSTITSTSISTSSGRP